MTDFETPLRMRANEFRLKNDLSFDNMAKMAGIHYGTLWNFLSLPDRSLKINECCALLNLVDPKHTILKQP